MDLFAEALADSDDGDCCETPVKHLPQAMPLTPPKESCDAVSAAAPPRKKAKGLHLKTYPRSRACQQIRFAMTPVIARDMVECILVPAKKGSGSQPKDASGHSTCVPFWPLYEVRDVVMEADLGSSWIRLSPEQQWLNDLASASGLQIRQINRFLVQKVSTDFKCALSAARLANVERHKKASLIKRKLIQLPLMYEAQLDGFSLHILDVLRPISLKVTPALREWLLKSFIPACERASQLETKDCGSQPKVGGAFSFVAGLMCHGVRGKISWEVTDRVWKLHVKKPSANYRLGVDLKGLSLGVNPVLGAGEYAESKSDAFYRAVVAWNEWDGSTRHRIKLTELGKESDWKLTAANEDGSQPKEDDEESDTEV